MGPFGFTDRNMFEEYYTRVLDSIYSEDWEGLMKLKEELLEMDQGIERYGYIWRHLASYTRAKVPKLNV